MTIACSQFWDGKWKAWTGSAQPSLSWPSSACFWLYNGEVLNMIGEIFASSSWWSSLESSLRFCDVWACSRSCRDRKRWSIYYGERTTIYTGELSRDIELTLIHLQLQSYMWRNITDITWHITWQVFTSIQLRRKELATLPPHLVKQRSIAFGVAFAFCIGSALSIIDFYVSRVSFEIWLI